MEKVFPRRAIHLDFHTMPGVRDVGADFDPDRFARTLVKAGVDYITVFARCNLGFAYYPTAIGTVHPGLGGRDLLGGMVTACRRAGIGTAAYFNAGLDHEHALRHREWCRVNRDGQVAEMGRMGHFFRRMCLNTGYREHLLGMIGEVMSRYPLDGLFLDCFTVTPCYGEECIEGMTRLGLSPGSESDGREYCRRVTADFAAGVKRIVRGRNRGALVCFNGLPYRQAPTHLELEVLPTGGWGYDCLPWTIRYARTLGKPFFTMTGRFHKSWGDFGGLRSGHSLLFDLYSSIANGGTCSIGDHLHPRGELEGAVYDLVGEVYGRIRELEKFTGDHRPLAEIAVVEPALAGYPGTAFDTAAVSGAARMLAELKCQFDVSDGVGDLSGYRVVILPDRVPVGGALKKKLRAHLAGGGALISSAWSGLAPGRRRFALPEYGLEIAGDEPNDPSYFIAAGQFADGLPEMPIAIYEPGVFLRAGEGADVPARLVSPYFNARSWDWRHENLYTPPEKETGRPALVRRGGIFHFSFPVFGAYHNDAVPAFKKLLGNCLETVLPRPMVRQRNLPSFARVTVTARENGRMIHVLAYLPELRGARAQVIEEPLVLRDVRLGLRLDGRPVERASLAPPGEPLDFLVEDGYAWVELEEVRGYQLIFFHDRTRSAP